MKEKLARFFAILQHPSHTRTETLLILLIVTLAIPLTIYIGQQTQDLRQRAYVVSNLLPGETCYNQGECIAHTTCVQPQGTAATGTCLVNSGSVYNGITCCGVDSQCASGQACTGTDSICQSGRKCAAQTTTPVATSAPETVPGLNQACNPSAVPACQNNLTCSGSPPTCKWNSGTEGCCGSATDNGNAYCATRGANLVCSSTIGAPHCLSGKQCAAASSSPTAGPVPTGSGARVCMKCQNNTWTRDADTNCTTATPTCETGASPCHGIQSDLEGEACGELTPTAGPGTPTSIANTPTTAATVNPISCDIDRNGCIGRADYNTWRTAYTTGVTRQGTDPDCNDNGQVELLDYNIWFNAMLTLPSSSLCSQ